MKSILHSRYHIVFTLGVLITIFVCVGLFVFGTEYAHAQETYQPISGTIPGLFEGAVDTGPGDFPEFINTVFQFLIGIAIVVSVVMVAFGGFRYITSAAAGSKESAKEMIRNALFGLILALASVVILQTINPNILDITPLKKISIKTGEERGFDPEDDIACYIETPGGIPSDTIFPTRLECEETLGSLQGTCVCEGDEGYDPEGAGDEVHDPAWCALVQGENGSQVIDSDNCWGSHTECTKNAGENLACVTVENPQWCYSSRDANHLINPRLICRDNLGQCILARKDNVSIIEGDCELYTHGSTDEEVPPGDGFTYTDGKDCSGCGTLDNAQLPFKSANVCEEFTPAECFINDELASKLADLCDHGTPTPAECGWAVTEAWPPSVEHAADCHRNGTCVDVGLRDSNGNRYEFETETIVMENGLKQTITHTSPEHAQAVTDFIAQATEAGLTVVYEVRTEAQKQALVAYNPDLEDHVHVIGGENTVPHFSVYRSPAECANGEPYC